MLFPPVFFFFFFFPLWRGKQKHTHIHGKIRFGQIVLSVSYKWEPFFDQNIKVSQKCVGIGRHLENPFCCMSGTPGSINLGGTGMSAEPVARCQGYWHSEQTQQRIFSLPNLPPVLPFSSGPNIHQNKATWGLGNIVQKEIRREGVRGNNVGNMNHGCIWHIRCCDCLMLVYK